MSAHTPGPWHVKPDPTGGDGSDNYRQIVAGSTVVPTGFCITDFISEADARLIAAAPELLEALRDLLALSDARGYLPSQNIVPVESARAAIAKAEGKP